jgi:hypothetical protein
MQAKGPLASIALSDTAFLMQDGARLSPLGTLVAKVKVKVKVKLSRCLTKQYAMKTYGECILTN